MAKLFPLSAEAINEIYNMEWKVYFVECAGHKQTVRSKEVWCYVYCISIFIILLLQELNESVHHYAGKLTLYISSTV